MSRLRAAQGRASAGVLVVGWGVVDEQLHCWIVIANADEATDLLFIYFPLCEYRVLSVWRP